MYKKYTRDEIEYLVKEVMMDVLCVREEDLKPEAKLNTNLGVDSLDAIDITMRLQRTFEIVIPDERLDAMRTSKLGDIYTLVDQLLSEKSTNG